jgi:hypothetical protein
VLPRELPESIAEKCCRQVHDFEARSPDELTLHKGERVELLERDGRMASSVSPARDPMC